MCVSEREREREGEREVHGLWDRGIGITLVPGYGEIQIRRLRVRQSMRAETKLFNDSVVGPGSFYGPLFMAKSMFSCRSK